VTFPNSIISIGNDAFMDNNLSSLTLPISLSTIGYNAFRKNKLTRVTIHNHNAIFGNGVFLDSQFINFSLPNRTTPDVYVAGTQKCRAVLLAGFKCKKTI
jgi:hypothetical protein